MTIEISPASTANTTKSAGKTEGPGSKTKATAGDAPATGGGFMAILGALGDASDASTTALPTVADDAPLSDPAAALPNAFDASLLLQQNPQIGAAQAAQAALAAAAATAAAAAAGSTGSAPVALPANAAPVAAGLVALSGQAPATASETPGLNKLPASAGGAAAKSADARAASSLATASDALPVAESLTQSLQHAGAHGKAGKELALNAAADAASTAASASSGDQAAAKDARLTAALEASKSPQVAKALEPVLAPLLAKTEKSQTERNALTAKSAEPTYGGTALGVSGPDFSQSATPAAMAPEMQAAEQVTYWVTQNVQNAELKLDGLGASPVEVSINVQGNEAQISFRSDEAATRGVLENATAHLKDLLQREGMVLTGVSVGTSSSGDAGGNSERRARPGARQTAIAPLQQAAVETGRRPGVPAGRSVDLFV
jgi:flagellar hook-length control protein FliK